MKKKIDTDYITKQAVGMIQQNPTLDPNAIAFKLQNDFGQQFKNADISQVIRNVQGMTNSVSEFNYNDMRNRSANFDLNYKSWLNNTANSYIDGKNNGLNTFLDLANRIGLKPRATGDGRFTVDGDDEQMMQFLKEAETRNIPEEFISKTFVPLVTDYKYLNYMLKQQAQEEKLNKPKQTIS